MKPKAIGTDNELGILIDSDLRGRVERPLLETFCPIVETPQPEHRFIPIIGDLSDLQKLQTQKYLLVVGTLDGEGEVAGLVGKMLSAEVVQGVERGEYFVFTKRGEWAREQLMMILVAPDAERLIQRLTANTKLLYSIFDGDRNGVVRKKLFRSYEQKELADDVRERFGFALRIPHDYVLVREEPGEGWLRLKRAAPSRWMTLWRSGPLEKDPVDTTWVFSTWSGLASKFADPVRANLDYLRFDEIDIGGNPGILMHGLWETVGPQGGGPFFCRAFYNLTDKRAYLLEGEVYNPGDVKEPYLKQLEVILDTFTVPEQEATY